MRRKSAKKLVPYYLDKLLSTRDKKYADAIRAEVSKVVEAVEIVNFKASIESKLEVAGALYAEALVAQDVKPEDKQAFMLGALWSMQKMQDIIDKGKARC